MKHALIVEDLDEASERMHEILTQAFEGISVSICKTLDQARTQLALRSFDLVVIDLGLPDGSGDDLLPEIAAQSPNCVSIVATIHGDKPRVIRALEKGAQGYLLKDQDRESLIAEFKGMASGRPPLSPEISRSILAHFNKAQAAGGGEAGDDPLSPREREVAVLTAKGLNRADIAATLGISANTVATHLKSIYTKLGVKTRAEMVVQMISRDLIEI